MSFFVIALDVASAHSITFLTPGVFSWSLVPTSISLSTKPAKDVHLVVAEAFDKTSWGSEGIGLSHDSGTPRDRFHDTAVCAEGWPNRACPGTESPQLLLLDQDEVVVQVHANHGLLQLHERNSASDVPETNCPMSNWWGRVRFALATRSSMIACWVWAKAVWRILTARSNTVTSVWRDPRDWCQTWTLWIVETSRQHSKHTHARSHSTIVECLIMGHSRLAAHFMRFLVIGLVSPILPETFHIVSSISCTWPLHNPGACVLVGTVALGGASRASRDYKTFHTQLLCRAPSMRLVGQGLAEVVAQNIASSSGRCSSGWTLSLGPQSGRMFCTWLLHRSSGGNCGLPT